MSTSSKTGGFFHSIKEKLFHNEQKHVDSDFDAAHAKFQQLHNSLTNLKTSANSYVSSLYSVFSTSSQASIEFETLLVDPSLSQPHPYQGLSQQYRAAHSQLNSDKQQMLAQKERTERSSKGKAEKPKDIEKLERNQSKLDSARSEYSSYASQLMLELNAAWDRRAHVLGPALQHFLEAERAFIEMYSQGLSQVQEGAVGGAAADAGRIPACMVHNAPATVGGVPQQQQQQSVALEGREMGAGTDTGAAPLALASTTGGEADTASTLGTTGTQLDVGLPSPYEPQRVQEDDSFAPPAQAPMPVAAVGVASAAANNNPFGDQSEHSQYTTPQSSHMASPYQLPTHGQSEEQTQPLGEGHQLQEQSQPLHVTSDRGIEGVSGSSVEGTEGLSSGLSQADISSNPAIPQQGSEPIGASGVGISQGEATNPFNNTKINQAEVPTTAADKQAFEEESKRQRFEQDEKLNSEEVNM